jgi:sugar O-acyltransferase (sialic acid O-acetyltransferase NeuD family)
MEKLYIFGSGGFAKEVFCLLTDLDKISSTKIYEEFFFVVPDKQYISEKIMGVTLIPESEFNPNSGNVVIAIGNPDIRKKVVEKLPKSVIYPSFIHPNVVLSEFNHLGIGNIIAAGSVLTCNIKIGNHSHFNLNSTIGHDCIIGDFFTSAPGVNLSGNCKIGDSVYLGANSCVKEGIKICNNVIVGMGSVVVKDILKPGVYVGNPAKKMD